MKRLIGRFYLWLIGWQVHPGRPPMKKFVIVAAPHTSNWDVPIMLAMSWILGVRVSWVGKHTLFRPPFGWLMRLLGGVPVDRRQRNNTVAQLVEEFNKRDELYLMVPPEGTRSRAEHWKSGFYHIAVGAGVPIVLGLLDYRRKFGGLYEVLEPTGDIPADMDKVRAFYAGATGKHPDDFGPIRLKEEDAVAASG